MRRKISTTAVFLAAVLVTASCSNVNPDAAGDRGGRVEMTPTVEVVEIRQGSLPLQATQTGSVRARNQTDIYPEIGGRIVEVLVQEGDRMRKGDVLVRLRDDEYRDRLRQAEHDREVVQAQLRQAEARLSRLDAEHRRTKELVELKLEAQLQLERIEADIREAEASIDLAEAQLRRAEAQIQEQRSALADTVVRAPIDGVVGNRNAEIGMRVDSGTRLFEIGDTSSMRVSLTLTEELANRVQVGDRVEIQSPYMSEPMVSSIRRFSPFLDPVTHTTIAEIEVANPGSRLQPGMFVSVDVFYGETEVTALIPKAALYEHAALGFRGVYLTDVEVPSGSSAESEEAAPSERNDRFGPNPVRFVPVEVGIEGRELISVRGLEGERSWVVVNGQHQLAEWESERAYVQPIDWDSVLRLQGLHSRDLFQRILGGSEEGVLGGIE